MDMRRRLLRTAIECLVVFVMLTTSVVGTGSITLSAARSAPGQPFAPAPSASGARITPDLNPAALPVGAWYAPYSPVFGPDATATPTTPQKRKPGEQPDLRTETSETFLNADGAWTLKSYPFPIHYKAYDAASELLSQCTSAGITSDTYDALGRVTSEERDTISGTCGNSPTLTFQASVTTTYDALGNKLEQLTNYPGGTSSDYQWSYDKLNRPLTMNDGTRSYTYDMNGNVTQMQVLNAAQAPVVTQNATYDGQNRLSSLNALAGSTTLHSESYQYDPFGDRSQIVLDSATTTYSYDNLTQLTTVQQGSTTSSYSYDANGNRVSMTTSAGTTTYTYDSADVMLTSKKDPSGKVTTYTYDTNGNLIKAVYDPTGVNQITTYSYDTNNRLTGISEPNGTTVSFSYDADGHRIQKKVVSGSTTTIINDVYALGHLADQTDGTGAILATFTYDTGGTPTSVTLGSGTGAPRYYYVYNGHGDVVALTDSSGAVVASYAYDAFGALTSSSETFPNNTANWTNPYRYDGAEGVRYDAETGLYWMSVRAYDPTLGRFLSHDPLGRLAALGLDTQPYVYANNNPVNKTDPSGLFVPTRALVDGGVAVAPPPPPAAIPPPPCLIPEKCAKSHGGSKNGQATTPGGGNGGTGQSSSPQPPKQDCKGFHVYDYLCSSGGSGINLYGGDAFEFFLGDDYGTLTAAGVYGMSALLYVLGELYDSIAAQPIHPPLSVTNFNDLISASTTAAGFVMSGPLGALIGFGFSLFINHFDPAQHLYDEEVSELNRARQSMLSAVLGAIRQVTSWRDASRQGGFWSASLTLRSDYLRASALGTNFYPVLDAFAKATIVGISFDIQDIPSPYCPG